MSHHSRSLDLHARNRVGAGTGESAPGTSSSTSTSNTQHTVGEGQNVTSPLEEQARRQRNRIYSSYDSLDNFADNFIKETTPDGEISVVLQDSNQDERGDAGESTGAQQETSFSRSESEQEKGTKDNNELDNGDRAIGKSIDIQTGESQNNNHHNNEPEMPGPSRDLVPLPTPGNNSAQDAPAEGEDEVRIIQPNNGNNVVVEIEDAQPQAAILDNLQPEEAVGYLEWYLDMLNSLGLSRFRRAGNPPLPPKQEMVKKVIFCVFTTLAFLETLRDIKSEVINVGPSTKKLRYCVRFSYVTVRLLNRCAFVHLICSCAVKVAAMLVHLRHIHENHIRSANPRKLPWSMGIASIIQTTVIIIFSHSSFSVWSIKDAFLTRSFFMSKSLFLWTTKQTKYENVTDDLWENYYEVGVTFTNFAFGVADGTFEFCMILQGEIIRDILLLAPVILLIGWRAFESSIQTQLLVHPNNADPAELEACLREYKFMRNANLTANNALSMVHKFMTTQNLFLSAYLFALVITFDDKDTDMLIVQTIAEVIKASVSYFISIQIHLKNGDVKTWLRLLSTYKGPVDVEGILGMTIDAALDDIRDNPIGFGTEYFQINESFLVGFFTALISIITFLVDQESPA